MKQITMINHSTFKNKNIYSRKEYRFSQGETNFSFFLIRQKKNRKDLCFTKNDHGKV